MRKEMDREEAQNRDKKLLEALKVKRDKKLAEETMSLSTGVSSNSSNSTAAADLVRDNVSPMTVPDEDKLKPAKPTTKQYLETLEDKITNFFTEYGEDEESKTLDKRYKAEKLRNQELQNKILEEKLRQLQANIHNTSNKRKHLDVSIDINMISSAVVL